MRSGRCFPLVSLLAGILGQSGVFPNDMWSTCRAQSYWDSQSNCSIWLFEWLLLVLNPVRWSLHHWWNLKQVAGKLLASSCVVFSFQQNPLLSTFRTCWGIMFSVVINESGEEEQTVCIDLLTFWPSLLQWIWSASAWVYKLDADIAVWMEPLIMHNKNWCNFNDHSNSGSVSTHYFPTIRVKDFSPMRILN